MKFDGVDEALDELERDGAWLRRAALALTSDPGLADDAAQLAWIQAWRWRSRQGGQGPSRGWLMQVLRNTVRGQHREGARRSVREQEVALTEQVDAPDPLQRIELQRLTLDAIEALDEPYRSTIVERFLDGRSIEEIARRSGLPRKTVETRSRRGIERLRIALGGERDRRGYAVLGLLQEVARDPSVTVGACAGAGAAPWLVAAAGAVLAIAGAGLVFLLRGEVGAGDTEIAVGAGRTIEGPAAHRAGDRSKAPRAPRTSMLRDGQVARGPGAASIASVLALDLDGRPVPDLEVMAMDPSGHAQPRSRASRTDSDGRAVVALPREEPVLADVAGREGWLAILQPRLVPGEVARIVVAERLDRGVRIVDRDGAPIEGARVRAQVEFDRFERFSVGDGVERIPAWGESSGEAGDVAIDSFPQHPSIQIEITANGFLPARLDSVDLPSVVELERTAPGALRGRVLDPLGTPVRGAFVGAGDMLVRTDDEGQFALPRARPTGCLRAVAAGFQPVRRRFGPGAKGIEIRLERAAECLPLAVDGVPSPGLVAVIEGEEAFGLATLELGASTFQAAVSAEGLASGHLEMELRPAPIDPESGRAVIRGLASRPYVVSIVAVARAEVVASNEVVPASRNVRIPVGRLGPTREVSGVVVTEDGAPVAGAEVRVGPSTTALPVALLRTAVTTKDGRFRFENLGGRSWSLQVAREPGARVDATTTVEAANSTAPLRIELPDRRRARIEVTDPDFHAARLTLLDSRGDPVEMVSRLGRSTVLCTSMTLGDGRTGVLEFSSRAVRAKLEAGSRAVEFRLPERRSEERDPQRPELIVIG